MKNKMLIGIFAVFLACVAVFAVHFLVSANGPDSTEAAAPKEVAREDEILADMTLEQKVGQMFMGCFYNGTPSPEEVEKYHLGGVLLFGASFKNTPKDELIASIDAIDEGCSITPILAVDEEGGLVTRVSSSTHYRSEPFASSRELFAQGGMDAIIADTHEKNTLLLELGIDMNLAPVCDISQASSDFMYSRSLGQDAHTTSEYATAVVKACREDGMACCLKHFPGYGNVADTHKGMAVDDRSLEQLQNNDYLPFAAGIEAGAHSVLVSHNIVSALDNQLPASLSPTIHQLLREEMQFDGVIVTDDLSMGAITEFSSDTDSAVAAILAGNDILCTGDFANQFSAVLEAIDSGVLTEEQVDESVRRILRLKLELGVLS